VQKNNSKLRKERLRQGLTQVRLAAKTGLSEETIQRAESGKGISLDSIEKICACLGKSLEQLDLLKIEDEGVNRREANKKIAAGLVGGLFIATSSDLLEPPLWERLSRTLTRSSNADEEAVQGLRQIAKSYWLLRTSIGYRSLLGGFKGHLETVEQLLRRPQSSATYKHLCSLASETAQYIGAIYFDMNDYSTAKAYYKVSIEAAKEAENHTLCAVGLGRMSSLPIYTDNPHEAIPLLREARRVARQHSPASICAWLASIEAEAHAHLDDERACIQLLGYAERVLERVGSDGNVHEVNFNYSRFLGYKGTCHLRLEKSSDALTALKESTSLIDASSVRQRSIIIVDSAEAYRQMGEIEEASKHAIQALELTDLTKSDLVLQRLLKVRADMQPWETTKYVKDFDAQMALRASLT